MSAPLLALWLGLAAGDPSGEPSADRTLAELIFVPEARLPSRSRILHEVPDAKRRLWVWATSPRLGVEIKERARLALLRWPEDDVRGLIHRSINDPATRAEHRLALIEALARAFPDNETLAFLTPLVRAEAIEDRVVAVRAIGLVRTPAARGVLLEALGSEKNPVIVALLKASLGPPPDPR